MPPFEIGNALRGKVVAVWLANDHRESRRKFACLFGLAGQPFWFYTSFAAGQWGIFAISFIYALAWLKGFRFYWWGK